MAAWNSGNKVTLQIAGAVVASRGNEGLQECIREVGNMKCI